MNDDGLAIPPQGPLLLQPDTLLHESAWDAAQTWFWQNIPSYLGFAELWLRLFAGWIAPVAVLFLLSQVERPKVDRITISKTRQGICLVALASSAIVMTDSNYVLEFGSSYGIALFLASLVLSLHACRRRKEGLLAVFLIVLTTATLTWDYEHNSGFNLGTPTDVQISIQEGLYYDKHNPLLRTAVEQFWSPKDYTYSTQATPWMLTGDARTGLPFFLNQVSAPDWKRVFLPVEDGEVLALDIAFPETGYNSSNPVYLLLHGANGGSAEEYCCDLARRRTQAGSTVIVMVSRGLMDLPLAGFNIFRADRLSDAHAAATAVRRAMDPEQMLAGIGYSMGAIVLNNYVATYGSSCALSAAFSISGALECRYEMDFQRPKRLWQPMIADHSRRRHLDKWGERMKLRLGKTNLIEMMRATNVVDLDQHLAIEHYRPRYNNLTHYYSEMGALGDIPVQELEKESPDIARLRHNRILNVSIPLCVLHALDDPIATWRGNTANQGLMHPENLVRLGKGNVLLLLSAKGGHVGWPVGWLSPRYGWQFMSEAAGSFVEAVARAQQEMAKAEEPRDSSHWAGECGCGDDDYSSKKSNCSCSTTTCPFGSVSNRTPDEPDERSESRIKDVEEDEPVPPSRSNYCAAVSQQHAQP